MIKDHQIAELAHEQKYTDVYPGFLFNFREYDNATYYIHISDFLIYQQVAAGEMGSQYKGKVNAGSMPLSICEEIGIRVQNQKLKVHFRYDIKNLVNDIKNSGRWTR